MKRSPWFLSMLFTMTMLAGCGTGADRLAARDTTVEYYRVFDIRTDATPAVVAQAATDGIHRNVKDAVVAAAPGAEATQLPGHFRMADPTAATSGSGSGTGSGTDSGSGAGDVRNPTCEGAAWTAKAAPRVRGGDNLHIVACLFPYRSGYHLDMYAVFTKPEGGWLAWPRRVSGAVLATPEQFTESTMMDIVRTIRTTTRAQVALVEAKPNLPGTPWLEGGDAPLAATATAEVSKP
jgi:hypothetical protein